MIALIAIIIIFLVFGYMLNFTILWIQGSEIIMLFFILAYTLFYLSCWLFLLFFTYKWNYKKLLLLYCIFWSAATVFFVLGVSYWPYIFQWLVLLFFFPIAGFDVLIFFMNYGFINANNRDAAMAVSFIMLLLGSAAMMRSKRIA